MTATISVDCMTRGPAPRVAAILELLRPHVHEIVVAVDDRAEPEVADTLSTVADRLVLYPFAEPVDRPLPWLHHLCSGDWVLTIDDDEVPSPALLEQLPALAEDDRVTHVWFRRRWLYPDVEHYLDAPPWRPDYLARFVRNDPRLLRFPTETHRPIEVLGPARYSDATLYHLNLVLVGAQERERKARKYERLLPGKRISGLPVNVAFYVPERVPDAPTAAVPPDDLALVQRVLSGEDVRGTRAAQLERATREQIDAHWEGRALSADAYRARIELAEATACFRAGEARTLDVRVENLGDAVWPAGEALPAVRVGARWPGVPGAEELRTPMPAEVRPGEAVLVPVAVAAPERVGRLRLVIDLVHEHVRWFGSELELAVDVVPQERVVLGRADASEIERLSLEHPHAEPVLIARTPEQLRGAVAARVAPSAHAYLLDGLSRHRPIAAVTVAGRSARLLWAAAAARRGKPSTLPRGAGELIETLADADRLVLNGQVPESMSDALVDRVTGLAARIAGVDVARR